MFQLHHIPRIRLFIWQGKSAWIRVCGVNGCIMETDLFTKSTNFGCCMILGVKGMFSLSLFHTQYTSSNSLNTTTAICRTSLTQQQGYIEASSPTMGTAAEAWNGSLQLINTLTQLFNLHTTIRCVLLFMMTGDFHQKHVLDPPKVYEPLAFDIEQQSMVLDYTQLHPELILWEDRIKL